MELSFSSFFFILTLLLCESCLDRFFLFLSHLLSREGQEEQRAKERLQEVSPTDEVLGKLPRKTAEVRPKRDPEHRGHPLLHPQRP